LLGIEDGSTESDGVEDGLPDGSIVFVGTLLGCSFGTTDNVGNILGCKDGSIDAEGKLLFSIDGEVLKLGLMVATEEGSIVIDGVEDTGGPCDGGVVMLMDGSVLPSMGLTLGVSIGDCEYDGSELILGW
jgi:hypothetical protein